MGLAIAQDPNLRPLEALFNLTNNAVSSFLGLGLSLCALELIRTGKTSLATGFSVLTKFLSLIGFWLLLGLLALGVIGVPVGVIALIGWAIESAGGDGVGLVVGFALGIPWLVIVGIVFSYRLAFYGPLLIVDREVSILQAFSLSWAMTKRNTLTLLCIFLVFGLGAIIGTCCTLGLGYFVVVPFVICLTPMCYHIMWEQYSAKTAHQDVTEW
ncbi:MAG: hypothetical protein FWH27_11735 [Planctomycetaceae bacterium]|nr:hypothetical protein [Planctomycetaceae bacterium]